MIIQKNGRPKILRSEYSSFRPDVIEFIKENVLSDGDIVLDPMAGTAPLIPYIESLNMKAIFNDLNPLHKYINRAKCYDVGKTILIRWERNENTFIDQILSLLIKLDNNSFRITSRWIPEDVVNIFIEAWNESNKYDDIHLSAFIKSIILLCIHPYSSLSRAKNYTWLKMGGMSTAHDVKSIVLAAINRYIDYYKFHYNDLNKKDITTNCELTCGEARSIKKGVTFNAIFTSPAYPNRYDFTNLYAPEIYFLNKIFELNKSELDGIENLKTRALATNVVAGYSNFVNDLKFIEEQAKKTFSFLMDVKEKGLPKEGDYYLKYYTRYFWNLFDIMSYLLNRLAPNGNLYMVVQNNIHRGELIEVDEFIKDYVTGKGCTVMCPFSQLRKHQGKRNISADYPLVIKKHTESIMRIKI